MVDFLQTTHRTVAWVKNSAASGELDIQPPYQRNPVWLEPQKSYLIDTILHGYPVPELYMQTVVTPFGTEKHHVVDGQQRIRACLEFLEGRFSINGVEGSPWDGNSFDDLSPEDKQALFRYQFVVRVLPDMPDDEIRAIFQRLNRNVVALSKQELRHATYWGPFIRLMEELASVEYWRSSGLFTANEVRRMLDVEFVSELAIGVLHGVQNKKTSLDRWYPAYEEEFPEAQHADRNFRQVLDELAELLPEISRTRWSKKSDFYSLFLWLSGQASEMPFSAERRKAIHDDLLEFARGVNGLTKGVVTQADVPSEVSVYTNAVQRAASDFANRRDRLKALTAFLAGSRSAPMIQLKPELIPSEEEVEEEDEYEEE